MPDLDPWGAFVDRNVDPTPNGNAGGPLAGLRLAVKDNIAVAGMKWTAGLPLFANRVAQEDASCVARLRAAGAIVVGTTVTDSAGFGMMTPGVVNPLAPDRTAGGSSGGSAAAVAGGLADIALGTDTGGSIRVPAACCGLYGLKPTFGRIALDNITPLCPAFDHVGLLAASLDLMQRATRTILPHTSSAPGQTRRIGFDPARLARTSSTIRSAVEQTLGWLAANGHDLQEIELPQRLPLAHTHGAIVCDEARAIWREYGPTDAARFGATASRALAYARNLGDAEISEARTQLDEARNAIDAAFAQVDLILGPTLAAPPPPAGARRVSFDGGEVQVVYALLAEVCPFNVSGHPALAMPLLHDDRGIPVSLQIAAHRDREDDAFSLARELESMGRLS